MLKKSRFPLNIWDTISYVIVAILILFLLIDLNIVISYILNLQTLNHLTFFFDLKVPNHFTLALNLKLLKNHPTLFCNILIPTAIFLSIESIFLFSLLIIYLNINPPKNLIQFLNTGDKTGVLYEFLYYPNYLKKIVIVTYIEFWVIYLSLIVPTFKNIQLHSVENCWNTLFSVLFRLLILIGIPITLFFIYLVLVNILFDNIKIKLIPHPLENIITVRIVDVGRNYGKLLFPINYVSRESNHVLIQFFLRKERFFLYRLYNLRYNIALIYHSYYSFLLFILFPELLVFIFVIAATSSNFEVYLILGILLIGIVIYKYKLIYANLRPDINLLNNILTHNVNDIDKKFSRKLEKAVAYLKGKDFFLLGIWENLQKLLKF